jgi:hypothetical protein
MLTLSSLTVRFIIVITSHVLTVLQGEQTHAGFVIANQERGVLLTSISGLS